MKPLDYLFLFMIPVSFALSSSPNAGAQERAFFDTLGFICLALGIGRPMLRFLIGIETKTK